MSLYSVDPVDRLESTQMTMRQVSVADRNRARLKTASMAVDAADLALLLEALGLDQPDETRR